MGEFDAPAGVGEADDVEEDGHLVGVEAVFLGGFEEGAEVGGGVGAGGGEVVVGGEAAGVPEVGHSAAEAGVPGYAAPTWTGVVAPAGVPRPIVDRLNSAINAALKSESFKEKFAKIGDEPGGGTPEEFAATIKADSAKWADVIKRSGAKLD